MSSMKVSCVCLAFFLILCQFIQLGAGLQVGFYNTSCPTAELIVKDEVTKGVTNGSGTPAGLIRMHFHDCFVRGCDGSVLIDSTTGNTAEKDSGANNPSLHGFGIIDSAKSRLESVCPGIVSCADILAFAARDSAELSGALTWDVPAGRRDGTISLVSEVLDNLPTPSFNLSQLTLFFANKGLSQDEMVTLFGAHTIGRTHCIIILNRLYNFNSTGKTDPSLDPSYAAQLKLNCPNNTTNTNSVVSLNPQNPTILNTDYYKNVINRRALFTSDEALQTSSATASQVSQNAMNFVQAWQQKFADAMVKMGNIVVLTGSGGEIRLNCRKIN